jgi:hypothetical protein
MERNDFDVARSFASARGSHNRETCHGNGHAGAAKIQSGEPKTHDGYTTPKDKRVKGQIAPLKGLQLAKF